ncbi:MAG: YajG family lipoprotein [Polaromonas sp.]
MKQNPDSVDSCISLDRNRANTTGFATHLGVNPAIFIKSANQIMNKNILAIASCVAIFSLSGCALTTDRIELQYKQQQGVSQIPGANNVSVNVQVSDQRQDKSKVSSKKNGFGMEMAPILATEDVAVTVRRAIEQELRTRGFQLGSDAALVQIAADITRFYNDHKVGFFAGDAVADLNMSVVVKSKNGDLLYTRHVVSQGIEPNTQLMTGENARLALNRALENGLKSLFEDQAFLSALVASSTSKSVSK